MNNPLDRVMVDDTNSLIEEQASLAVDDWVKTGVHMVIWGRMSEPVPPLMVGQIADHYNE